MTCSRHKLALLKLWLSNLLFLTDRYLSNFFPCLLFVFYFRQHLNIICRLSGVFAVTAAMIDNVKWRSKLFVASISPDASIAASEPIKSRLAKLVPSTYTCIYMGQKALRSWAGLQANLHKVCLMAKFNASSFRPIRHLSTLVARFKDLSYTLTKGQHPLKCFSIVLEAHLI